MDRRPFDLYLNNQRAPEAQTTSLAGRELPEDLVQQVSNLSMGQLFYILGHIQKLSAQAPVTAQALLAEHPQICYALLHAECLAGMIEDPLLPMTAEELQQAKAKSRRMREELENHQLPQPEENSFGVMPKYGRAPAAHGLSRPSPMGGGQLFCKAPGLAPGGQGQLPPRVPFQQGPGMMFPGMPPPTGGGMVPPPPSSPPPGAAAPAAGGAGGDEQKQHLMQKLVQLTPEQIARLPEHTKVQLLQFLQQRSG